MPLTKRRLQFLGQLVDLYQHSSLPIHYETLARSLGVSKWTAYDMLKEMEKLGFVTRSYEVNAKETGRSQVVFAPTTKAAELFAQNRSEPADPAEWEQTLLNIKQLLISAKDRSINDVIRKVMDEIPAKASSLEFCSYILGLLLVYLKKLGGKTESLVRLMIGKMPNGENRVLLFAGTVLGTIIQSINDELGNELIELVSEFFLIMNQLPGNEQQLLSNMLQEALA